MYTYSLIAVAVTIHQIIPLKAKRYPIPVVVNGSYTNALIKFT